MSRSKDYMKIVKWSYEDECYVGVAPSLFSGGCDGQNELDVFAQLCVICDEWIEIIERDGERFPLADPPHITDVVQMIEDRKRRWAREGVPEAAE